MTAETAARAVRVARELSGWPWPRDERGRAEEPGAPRFEEERAMDHELDSIIGEYVERVLAGTAKAPDYAKVEDHPEALRLISPGLPLLARWLEAAQADPGFWPVFVLGSADAEMVVIERMLREMGGCFVFFGGRSDATKPHGVRRVAPGESATCLVRPVRESEHYERVHAAPYSRFLVGVELRLELADVGDDGTLLRLCSDPIIDHHAPGDPRTGAAPEWAWIASSAGQVAYLRAVLTGPRDQTYPIFLRDTLAAVMAGESDHNLPAFCAGRGYTPADLARRYALSTRWAAFGDGLTFKDFSAAVDRAVETLREAAKGDVADLRHLPIDGPVVKATGEQYPAAAQFLPVAASISGIGYLAHIRRRDGKLALRIGGLPPDHVVLRYFERHPEGYGCLPADAPRPDNAYAFPARGMGGGTLIDQTGGAS